MYGLLKLNEKDPTPDLISVKAYLEKNNMPYQVVEDTVLGPLVIFQYENLKELTPVIDSVNYTIFRKMPNEMSSLDDANSFVTEALGDAKKHALEHELLAAHDLLFPTRDSQLYEKGELK